MASGFRLADPREYRRGVILGLTLAEILVLLVFLLLLSSGALLARRSREVRSLEIKLSEYDSILAPALERMRLLGHEVKDADDLVARLQRASETDQLARELDETKSALETARAEADRSAHEAADLRSRLASFSEDTRVLAGKALEDDRMVSLLEKSAPLGGSASDRLQTLLDRAAKQAEDNSILTAMLEKAAAPGDNAPERLKGVLDRAAKQAAMDLNLTGQNAQMRAELIRLKGNGGSGLPYCWTTSDGRPVYIMRIELHDEGVVVNDLEPRPRPDDHVWALLETVPRQTTIAVSTLLAAAGPLQAEAEAAKCRFAVLAIDGTARTNKPGYKSLMGNLWSAFMVKEVQK